MSDGPRAQRTCQQLSGSRWVRWFLCWAVTVFVALLLPSSSRLEDEVAASNPARAVSPNPSAALPKGIVVRVGLWLRVLDVTTGAVIRNVRLPSGRIREDGFSPDWSMVAWLESDGRAVVAELRGEQYTEIASWTAADIERRVESLTRITFLEATGQLLVGAWVNVIEPGPGTFVLDPKHPKAKPRGSSSDLSWYMDSHGTRAEVTMEPVVGETALKAHVVSSKRGIVEVVTFQPTKGQETVTFPSYRCLSHPLTTMSIACVPDSGEPKYGAVAILTRDATAGTVTLRALVPEESGPVLKLVPSPDHTQLLLQRQHDLAITSASEIAPVRQLVSDLAVDPGDTVTILGWS